jgi:hypothetical protein
VSIELEARNLSDHQCQDVKSCSRQGVRVVDSQGNVMWTGQGDPSTMDCEGAQDAPTDGGPVHFTLAPEQSIEFEYTWYAGQGQCTSGACQNASGTGKFTVEGIWGPWQAGSARFTVN